MRRALALLLFAACSEPTGLPTTVAPGLMPGGVNYPDPMVRARGPVGGGSDAALIIAIEDYARLGARPGARAMGAAWYRYLRDERLVEPRRMTLLRDGEATPRAIHRALERARWWGQDGVLWVVVIGHIGSALPGAYGDLWLASGDGQVREGHAQPLAPLLGRAAYGRHARAVVVLDGCLAGGPQVSGTATPPTPRFRRRNMQPVRGGDENREWSGPSRRRREPSDVAIFSAGLGPGCVAQLPGTQFPALSYLLLGGLRGWADGNGNGNVTAVELLTHTALLLRAAAPAAPRPQPSLYGPDITLARRVKGVGPTLAQLRAPGSPEVTQAELLREPLAWTTDPMVSYERGSFMMGCPDRRDSDCERDERSNRVKLSRFQIDPQEVTQAEYRRCVAAGQCSPIDPRRCFVWTGDAFVRGAPLPEPLTRDDHPVVCVDWWQAERYCDVVEKHLPTEAQWERAAAGTTRRRFPWGADEPTCDRAQFDGCGEHTRPVGLRPKGATPEGVQDLAGNASEWVHDWYDRETYWDLLRGDPVGADYGVVRVVRGGSYYDAPALLRWSYRYGLNPVSSFSTVGFRCAR